MTGDLLWKLRNASFSRETCRGAADLIDAYENENKRLRRAIDEIARKLRCDGGMGHLADGMKRAIRDLDAAVASVSDAPVKSHTFESTI